MTEDKTEFTRVAHGADVDVMCVEYGIKREEVIDFSSNINIYTPEIPAESLLEALNECREYPDRRYTELRGEIAEYLDVPTNHVYVGNGASEIIGHFMRCMPERIAILSPTYGEYERFARLLGKKPIILRYEYDDLFIDSNELNELNEPNEPNEPNRLDRLDDINGNNANNTTSDNKGNNNPNETNGNNERDASDMFAEKTRMANERLLSLIRKEMDSFDALFICNPNNPDGILRDVHGLWRLLKENDKALLIDETFIEFTYGGEFNSLKRYVADEPNLYIIRAATKFFGLPGLRLGYGLSGNPLAKATVEKYSEPWAVNGFAVRLAKDIFSDREHTLKSKTYYATEKLRMREKLSEIDGIEILPSDANYYLIRFRGRKVSDIKREMLIGHRILVRDCSSFGLEDCIRVAIKDSELNDRLIKALKDVI